MATMFPRGYGGFPTYQFSAPNQYNNQYYTNGYTRQGTFFAPHYPTQPFYQPPYYPTERYLSTDFNQFRRPGINTQIVGYLNKLDDRYRQEQYLSKLGKIEKQYYKLHGTPLPANYNSNIAYEYAKETKYVPFPVYIGPQTRGHSGVGNLGYNVPWNTNYPTSSNLTYGAAGTLSLPPKIRVIFIPTGQSCLQQPYTGPLAMPPFLYNRISQPLCSFPLPPPLPQLGSLPLTPAVQQMVVQRYSNPVAVLPFTPNWQMPQPMMSSCSQVSPYQQQAMLPISAFQSMPTVPQPVIPPPMPICSSLPPAPQLQIPPYAPMLAFPSLAPAPPTASAPILSSLPPAPQSYIPPPPPMLANLPVLSPPSLQAPLPDANAASLSSQYYNSSYPIICRACPPAPPSLNIAVTGHCWVQHCAACHHVPTPISNPNARPNGGRITPLLRYPTVPQYVPDQTRQPQPQQQQYFQTNAPVMMRPWLRKTPPLPPGAILISDEYINKNGSSSQYDHSRRRHHRSSHPKNRSTTVTSRTTSTSSLPYARDNKSVSPIRTNKNHTNSTQQQGVIKSHGTVSKTSSSTSSSGLSAEYRKVTIHPSKTNEKSTPQQLAGEARNINVQYKYQPQELPSVYLINRYLKSSSEASTAVSNFTTSSDRSPSSIKEHSTISSPSSDFNRIQEEEPNSEKEDEKSIRSPSQLKHSSQRVIIIREFMTSSPSTISTISSNTGFIIIDKDTNLTAATSSLKTNKLEEDDVVDHQIF